MDRIIYEELRKLTQEANGEENCASRFFETANYIRIAADKARKEGLLIVDPEYGTISEDIPEQDLFMPVLWLVSNGTEAELITEICLMRYFSDNLRGTEGILALMRLVGGLSIQAGDNQKILLRKLDAMIPSKFYVEYKILLNDAILKNEKTHAEKLDEEIEKMCARETTNLDEKTMNITDVLLDRVLEEAQNQDIKKILESIPNNDLILALKKMGGKATQKIRSSMSKEMLRMIVDDMLDIGPARLSDVEEAKSNILSVIIKMMKQNELVSDNFKLLLHIMEGK